jgi:hypothetical protein
MCGVFQDKCAIQLIEFNLISCDIASVKFAPESKRDLTSGKSNFARDERDLTGN